MFLITLYVGSSHTGLDLLLFQKLHQAQLLEEGRDAVEESPPGAMNVLQELPARAAGPPSHLPAIPPPPTPTPAFGRLAWPAQPWELISNLWLFLTQQTSEVTTQATQI